MNESEIKTILNDPKQLLDLFRVFHQLIHIYESQQTNNSGTTEKVGLKDSVEINVSNSNKQKEVNK